MKKLFAIILVSVLAALALSACVTPDEEFNLDAYNVLFNNIIISQESYLKSLQLPSGAFCKWSGGFDNNTITPYFACFVALALLENPANVTIVKSYCDWHFSALNTEGDINGLRYTVYDYTLKDEVPVPSYYYDSTDSYAALFLIVLAKYYSVTADINYIHQHKTEINGIADVISATRIDDLNFAKPDYKIKYLMDNCEVYAGLAAAEALYLALNDNARSADAAKLKNATSAAIMSKLYNKTNNLYLPYDGAAKADATKFYPDMVAQLYPVIFGIVPHDAKKSVKVYKTFKKRFGNAEKLNKFDSFPWLLVAYGAAMYQDYAFATDLLANAYDKYMSDNAYPWYSMEAAMSLLTAYKLKH